MSAVTGEVARLVELVGQAQDGDFAELTRLVEANGGQVDGFRDDTDGVIVRTEFGMTVGLTAGMDPPSAVVQVGFALMGEIWPLTDLFPLVLGEVTRAWRDRMRDVRAEAATR